jgi:ketosteroid isomerase-like protein
MSQGNLQVALSAVDAVADMDEVRLLELTDPEVEWHSFLAELGEDGVYRGHAGVRQYVNDLRDAWEMFEAKVDDTAGHLAKFRAGRIVFMRAFRDPEKALERLGRLE